MLTTEQLHTMQRETATALAEVRSELTALRKQWRQMKRSACPVWANTDVAALDQQAAGIRETLRLQRAIATSKNFCLQVMLVTERVMLRAIRREDAATYDRYFGDYETMQERLAYAVSLGERRD